MRNKDNTLALFPKARNDADIVSKTVIGNTKLLRLDSLDPEGANSISEQVVQQKGILKV